MSACLAIAPIDVAVPPAAIETFRCRALSCWISRAQCAAKFKRFNDDASQRQIDLERGRFGGACVGCELGAAHRRQESPVHWPDGELLQVRILRTGATSDPVPRSEEQPGRPSSSPPKVDDRAAPRTAVLPPVSASAVAEASRSTVSPLPSGTIRTHSVDREVSGAAEPRRAPTPARFRAASADRKLSPIALEPYDGPGRRQVRPVPAGPFCAATYVSIDATCPTSCRFRENGCYVRAGFTRHAADILDAGARELELDGDAVIDREIDLIDRAFGRRRSVLPRFAPVPQDGARGGRDLRLHVGGDTTSIAATVRLAGAAIRWRQRGGGAVWAYTHRWEKIPRDAWGPISALASVETVADANRAWLRGYVPALVVPEFPSERAFRVRGLHLKVIPCPAETRNTNCVSCRLCLDDRRLHRMGAAIGFAIHGGQAARVRLPVLREASR